MDNSSVFKLDGALIGGLVDKKKVRYKDKFKKQTFGCEDCKTHLGFTLDEMNALFDSILGDAKCTDCNCPYLQIPGRIPDICSQRITYNKMRVVRPDLAVAANKKLKKKRKHRADPYDAFYRVFWPYTQMRIPKEVWQEAHVKYGHMTWPKFVKISKMLNHLFVYQQSERQYCRKMDAIDHWDQRIQKLYKLTERDREMYAVYENVNEDFLYVPKVPKKKPKPSVRCKDDVYRPKKSEQEVQTQNKASTLLRNPLELAMQDYVISQLRH